MEKTDVVYATSTAMVDGYRIVKGQYWHKDDPLVRAHPDLFSDDPREGSLSTTVPIWDDAPVESVTAGPGERRSQVKRG